VALRQRHRQSWGWRCPCPRRLTSGIRHGSPSPVRVHRCAEASRPHRGWHRPGRVGTAPVRLPGRRPCRASYSQHTAI